MATKSLAELLDNVSDEVSFLQFVDALAADCAHAAVQEKARPSTPYGPGARGWENTTIEHFLESAAAWARDSTLDRIKVSHPTICGGVLHHFFTVENITNDIVRKMVVEDVAPFP